jgi:hypothetical protein
MTREAAGTATGEAALIRRAGTDDAAAVETLIAPRLDPLYRTAWAASPLDPAFGHTSRQTADRWEASSCSFQRRRLNQSHIAAAVGNEGASGLGTRMNCERT